MPIRFEKDRALLSGICGAETAEPLLAWLSEQAQPQVDLSECKHLHAAVLQVLLVARPQVAGIPGDPFLREHVFPLLDAARSERRAGV